MEIVEIRRLDNNVVAVLITFGIFGWTLLRNVHLMS